MHFSSILSVAAAFTAITAFTIPDGLADGVYSAYLDAEGNQITTLLSNSTAKRDIAIRGATREKSKRSGTPLYNQVVCKGSIEGTIPTSDNAQAATLLANQCGNGAAVGGGLNYFSIIGCSVAYFCNGKSDPEICTAGNAWNCFNTLNNVCGPSVPGYQIYYDSNGHDQYGYENYCSSSGATSADRWSAMPASRQRRKAATGTPV